MKILHVSDSYNAGVQAGIEHLALQFREHEHYLLWSSHRDSPAPTENSLHEFFTVNTRWQGNLFHKLFQLQRMLSKHQIDAIHLHSSVAGVIGRVLPTKVRKIYSPHCFAFQREDISTFLKAFYFIIEYLLSYRGCTLALCWPIEIQISKKYFQKSEITFMPIVNYNHLYSAQLKPLEGKSKILCVGRIRPQKDPAFLCQAVKNLGQIANALVWIGEGDEDLTKMLIESKIKIYQWMDRGELWNSRFEISGSCIPSSWESGPLTLFESLESGYPVVCRAIPSLDIYGFQTFKTPESFGVAIKQMLNSELFRKEMFEQQVQGILRTFENLEIEYSKSLPY